MYALVLLVVFFLSACSGQNSGSANRQVRFSVDATTPSYNFTVEGHSKSLVTASLVGSEGKRAFSYQGGKEGKCQTTVTEGDWNLPPEAVMNKTGQVVICWNHLSGASSEFTYGPLPDPQHGVELFCSLYDTNCTLMAERIRVGASYPVAWLRDVTAQANGTFVIEFMYESGWLSTPTLPEHGTYQQSLSPSTQQLTDARRVQADCIL